jgi:hypothetical protein
MPHIPARYYRPGVPPAKPATSHVPSKRAPLATPINDIPETTPTAKLEKYALQPGQPRKRTKAPGLTRINMREFEKSPFEIAQALNQQ